MTQNWEELAGRETKKLSQDFVRTENQFPVALSKLDDFRLDAQVRMRSETAPKTCRSYDVEWSSS